MTGASPRIYLDHNATSPLRDAARGTMLAALERCEGNPASLHAEGRAASALLDGARERVAELLSVSPTEVVFTSGGSEAIAAAVRGVCDRAPIGLRRIVVASVEHSAVLEAVRQAAPRGFDVIEVPCDRDGRVDAGQFLDAASGPVALAALQWANNETGVIQPVEEVGQECRRRGVAFFIDAVQAAGKVRVEPHRVRADLLAVSGHKIGGPQGTGALFVREGIVLAPLVCGGAQEKRRRGGTPGVAALAGFGAAARAAGADLPDHAERLLLLRAKIETRLRNEFPRVRFHGQAAPRLPNTVNFGLDGVEGEMLVVALDLAGVAVSTGSACASGAVEPSHVIRAMGCDERESRRAVRVSLGWSTTAEEVDRFLEILPAVARQVRDGMDSSRG